MKVRTPQFLKSNKCWHNQVSILISRSVRAWHTCVSCAYAANLKIKQHNNKSYVAKLTSPKTMIVAGPPPNFAAQQLAGHFFCTKLSPHPHLDRRLSLHADWSLPFFLQPNWPPTTSSALTCARWPKVIFDDLRSSPLVRGRLWRPPASRGTFATQKS